MELSGFPKRQSRTTRFLEKLIDREAESEDASKKRKSFHEALSLEPVIYHQRGVIESLEVLAGAKSYMRKPLSVAKESRFGLQGGVGVIHPARSRRQTPLSRRVKGTFFGDKILSER